MSIDKGLLSKLQSYCAYQDRCFKEVKQKALLLGIDHQEISEYIDLLISDKFIDEVRYAESFTRGKHNYKNWGRLRIQQELKHRNISSHNIRIGWEEIEKDYVTNFYKLAEKKWEDLMLVPNQKQKKKWIDFLLRKGYESDLIYNALKDFE